MISVAATVISSAYDAALSIVYPQGCAVCGRSVESRHDGVACAECWAGTHIFAEDAPLCGKCGALSEAPPGSEHLEQIRCGQCDPDHFSAARAGGLYEGALRASVLALKRVPHVDHRLLQTMRGALLQAPLGEIDLIVPVPLHPARERQRGFNQAAVLARALARTTGLPIDEHSLVRRIHTERHRAGMDARARRESVANAFAVRQKLISGRRVLLIDDVFTTGATVSECAAVLKSAGASEVYVLTVARL